LLHQDVLDHLHILANYQWDAKALWTVGLVGLPELWDRMMLRRNRALWSRIHCRIHLGEAEPADTAEYVRHRLTTAGTDRQVFSSDAIALLHEGCCVACPTPDGVALQLAVRQAEKSTPQKIFCSTMSKGSAEQNKSLI